MGEEGGERGGSWGGVGGVSVWAAETVCRRMYVEGMVREDMVLGG